jgi:hypothetical protein
MSGVTGLVIRKNSCGWRNNVYMKLRDRKISWKVAIENQKEGGLY